MKQMYSYNNSVSPTTDLPFGAFSNESAQGQDDGTQILAEQMQDLYYALYSVLQLAGQTPNGNLENGNASKQFLSALSNIGIIKHNNTSTYNNGQIAYTTLNGAVTFYKSLQASNTAALSNTSYWLPLIRIDANGTINFLVDTNPNLYGTFLCGGILETPNGVVTYTSTTITFKSGIKFVAANGRNANGTAKNLIATLPSDITISDLSGYSKYNIIGVSSIDNGATWRADGVADFQFYISTTTPIIDPNKGVRALWFNPDLNVWKDTADGGVTWITILFYALIRTDNDINTTGHPLTAIRDFNTVKFLNAYDSIITQLDKPDFSKKISLPFATYYYAEDDGFIYVETEIYAPAGNTIKVEAKVNGNTVFASGASGHLDNTTIASGNFKVSAGDLFIIQKTVQTGIGEVINYSGYFVPVKREWV